MVNDPVTRRLKALTQSKSAAARNGPPSSSKSRSIEARPRQIHRSAWGTELGVPLDKSRSEVSSAILDAETATVHVCGELTLDYVPVNFAELP
jgi:hypothetical protein